MLRVNINLKTHTRINQMFHKQIGQHIGQIRIS